MTPLANASPAARTAAWAVAGLALAGVGATLTLIIALAGTGQLAPDLDWARLPAWIWRSRHDPELSRWLGVGAGSSALLLIVMAAAAALSRRRPLHGAARWANGAEIARAGLRARSGIVIGQAKGRPLVFDGPEHVLLHAPTRTGKGVGVVIPNLLTWPGSVVVLDVKQENWAATAGYRAGCGQTVWRFDPLDPQGRTARYNPLGHINRRNPVETLDELQKIATMLFPAPEHADPFWNEAARTGFIGVGAYVAETQDLPFTLGEIFRQLTGGDPRRPVSRPGRGPCGLGPSTVRILHRRPYRLRNGRREHLRLHQTDHHGAHGALAEPPGGRRDSFLRHGPEDPAVPPDLDLSRRFARQRRALRPALQPLLPAVGGPEHPPPAGSRSRASGGPDPARRVRPPRPRRRPRARLRLCGRLRPASPARPAKPRPAAGHLRPGRGRGDYVQLRRRGRLRPQGAEDGPGSQRTARRLYLRRPVPQPPRHAGRRKALDHPIRPEAPPDAPPGTDADGRRRSHRPQGRSAAHPRPQAAFLLPSRPETPARRASGRAAHPSTDGAPASFDPQSQAAPFEPVVSDEWSYEGLVRSLEREGAPPPPPRGADAAQVRAWVDGFIDFAAAPRNRATGRD